VRNAVRTGRWFGGQVRKVGCQLVDKSLARISSNVHSKSCPRGPTFTAEPAWGAIPRAVPGDRTVPQGRRRRTERRIDQSRWAVRQSTDNRFLRALRCPPPRPQGTIHAGATHGARSTPRLSTAGLRSVSPRTGICIPEASPVSTEWATVHTISGSSDGARLRPGIPHGHQTRYAAATSLPDRPEPSNVAPPDLTAGNATIVG
jgi:hypothetical protein